MNNDQFKNLDQFLIKHKPVAPHSSINEFACIIKKIENSHQNSDSLTYQKLISYFAPILGVCLLVFWFKLTPNQPSSSTLTEYLDQNSIEKTIDNSLDEEIYQEWEQLADLSF